MTKIIGNAGTGPSTYRYVKSSNQADLDAYDELSPVVRKKLREMPVQVSSVLLLTKFTCDDDRLAALVRIEADIMDTFWRNLYRGRR